MTCKFVVEYLRLGVILIALPSFAANSADQSGAEPAAQHDQVTSTQHIDFASGGAIHIDGSYGILRVEGWDRPEVAITVTKSLPPGYERNHPEKAKQRLESVRIVGERKSGAELAISTSKNNLGIDYEIQVPSSSNLAIHHRVGFVSVSGVTGDIDATCRRGDLVLWLPENASYSIDARSTVGTVSSDLPGAFSFRYLVGRRFSHADPSPSHRITLRDHFGGITIQRVLPESVAPIASIH
jgi:hypothetical protein